MMFLALALALALPAGWTPTADGPRHEASTLICPATFRDFTLTGIEAGADALTLALCRYTGPSDRSGFVRLRLYQRGAGETPQAERNDIALMEPDDKGKRPQAVARSGLTKDDSGREWRLFTMTVRKNGYLVDCQARTPADGPPSDPAKDISSYCFRAGDPQ